MVVGGLVSSEQSSSTTAGCLLACQLVHKERTINRPPLGQQSNRIELLLINTRHPVMLMAVVVNGYSNIGGIGCVLLFQGCA